MFNIEYIGPGEYMASRQLPSGGMISAVAKTPTEALDKLFAMMGLHDESGACTEVDGKVDRVEGGDDDGGTGA